MRSVCAVINLSSIERMVDGVVRVVGGVIIVVVIVVVVAVVLVVKAVCCCVDWSLISARES